MAWCPKCKYEYREGITVCPDCDCELVDDLSLVCEEPSFDPSMLFNLQYDEDERPEKPEKVELYVNNQERADENKSSAWTLLLVGVAGLATDICYFLGIIPNHMSDSGKYMVCGVMGVMFLLFLIMGFVSLRNSRLFMKKAYSENNLTETIKNWLTENVKKDEIDEKLGFTDEAEELRYFGRISEMKDMINDQYMNLEGSYIDRIIEEIYPEIFEA
ncbi:MAG: hypothetical protein K5888_04605 [Lachnospiraceae bacterium]|nr:hypothetical protein [Lachnospiraceae bacterium]